MRLELFIPLRHAETRCGRGEGRGAGRSKPDHHAGVVGGSARDMVDGDLAAERGLRGGQGGGGEQRGENTGESQKITPMAALTCPSLGVGPSRVGVSRRRYSRAKIRSERGRSIRLTSAVWLRASGLPAATAGNRRRSAAKGLSSP